jgi:hypothetical protein
VTAPINRARPHRFAEKGTSECPSVFHPEDLVLALLVVVHLDFDLAAIAVHPLDVVVVVVAFVPVVDLDLLAGTDQVATFDLDAIAGVELLTFPGTGGEREQGNGRDCQ